MVDKEHPITPPPELVQQWLAQHADYEKGFNELLIEAAQWGADQEVGACCQWLVLNGYDLVASKFHAARRPKPPSLKEQAMRVFLEAGYTLGGRMELEPEDIDIIHRALEQLND